MEYTKGEWKYTRPQVGTSRGIICIMVEPHYMPDCGDTTWYNGCVEVMIANAHLIAAAVNACASVNPDNPWAVAKSIGDMYKALEWIAEDIESDEGTQVKVSTKTAIWKALAKAEGK